MSAIGRPLFVMPGHSSLLLRRLRIVVCDAGASTSSLQLTKLTWMAGTSPAMTATCASEPEIAYDLKKLFAASFDARFLVIAACSRSISEFISAMRSASSSTDNSDRSCPISW